jgi:peptidoglycan hydrolase-like protein with peptidoglycan-binding domain
MEAYDSGNTACRESALSFLSGWTRRLHKLDYVSGVYSSAGSGIADLDNARVNRPGVYAMPDRIWIARWDGQANTSTSYIRDDGWLPGGRMKQYAGGHNETWGGVTINIDSNWLDLGNGSAAPPPTYCGGVRLSFRAYPELREGATGDQVKALQCLLTTKAGYAGKVTGTLDTATMDAVVAWRTAHGLSQSRVVGPAAWMTLHAAGKTSLLKYGATGEKVRRLQRTLNAAGTDRLPVNGVFAARTTAAVKGYQKDRGMAQSGVVTNAVWKRLRAGKF